MKNIITFLLIALIFILFEVGHFTGEISNYDYWIVIFLVFIAIGVNKPTER